MRRINLNRPNSKCATAAPRWTREAKSSWTTKYQTVQHNSSTMAPAMAPQPRTILSQMVSRVTSRRLLSDSQITTLSIVRRIDGRTRIRETRLKVHQLVKVTATTIAWPFLTLWIVRMVTRLCSRIATAGTQSNLALVITSRSPPTTTTVRAATMTSAPMASVDSIIRASHLSIWIDSSQQCKVECSSQNRATMKMMMKKKRRWLKKTSATRNRVHL